MDLKELQSQLQDMKSAIEANAEKKANEIVAQQLEAVNATLTELKAKQTASPDELKAVKADLDVTIKALDTVMAKMKSVNMPQANPVAKTLGGNIVNLVETQKDAIVNFDKKGGNLQIPFDTKAVVTMTTGNAIESGGIPVTYRQGLVPKPFELVHMRNIFAVTPSATDSYHFYRHTSIDGTPAYQVEGETKAKISDKITEISVILNDLAGYELISRKMLRNFPALQSYLGRWLPERYYLEEDAKGVVVLAAAAGAGSTVTSGTPIERMIEAMGLQKNAKYNVNGILVNGKSWSQIILNKATGSGEFDLPPGIVSVTPMGGITVAGVPVYTASWVQEDQCYLGDFSMFEIIQSEALTLRFSEEDGENFKQNLVTARIEASIGFAFLDPAAIARVDLGQFAS